MAKLRAPGFTVNKSWNGEAMAHWIQVLTGPLEGMTFSVSAGQAITLGRVNGNDVLLAFDPWISSQHGMIKYQDGQIFLMDTGSSNGSFVNAERLRAHSYVPVNGFFVLGATVFKIRRTGHPVVGEPLPVSHPDLASLLDSPLWRSAIDISRERRFPMVHSLHLLMALRRGHRTQVDQLLREMEADLQDLDSRLEQLEVFTGERTWMNRFIKYQTKVPHQRETLVTPLLQRLVKAVGAQANAPKIVEKLMSTSYNLIYPLLGLPSPDARPATGLYSTKDTKPAKDMAEALAQVADQPEAPQRTAAEPHVPSAQTPPRPMSSPQGEALAPPPFVNDGKGTVALDLAEPAPPAPPVASPPAPEPPPQPSSEQSDHQFASKIEGVIHRFIKDNLGYEMRYSDGSQSIQAHKTLSLSQKERELEQQLETLLGSLVSAFEVWFEGFLEQIDPNTLEKVAGADGAARWQEFRYRFELMDQEFTRNHFLDIAIRMLKKQLKI